jgi:hypothetical protein
MHPVRGCPVLRWVKKESKIRFGDKWPLCAKNAFPVMHDDTWCKEGDSI